MDQIVSQLCHVNMLKKFVERDDLNNVKPVAVSIPVNQDDICSLDEVAQNE